MRRRLLYKVWTVVLLLFISGRGSQTNASNDPQHEYIEMADLSPGPYFLKAQDMFRRCQDGPFSMHRTEYVVDAKKSSISGKLFFCHLKSYKLDSKDCMDYYMNSMTKAIRFALFNIPRDKEIYVSTDPKIGAQSVDPCEIKCYEKISGGCEEFEPLTLFHNFLARFADGYITVFRRLLLLIDILKEIKKSQNPQDLLGGSTPLPAIQSRPSEEDEAVAKIQAQYRWHRSQQHVEEVEDFVMAFVAALHRPQSYLYEHFMIFFEFCHIEIDRFFDIYKQYYPEVLKRTALHGTHVLAVKYLAPEYVEYPILGEFTTDFSTKFKEYIDGRLYPACSEAKTADIKEICEFRESLSRISNAISSSETAETVFRMGLRGVIKPRSDAPDPDLAEEHFGVVKLTFDNDESEVWPCIQEREDGSDCLTAKDIKFELKHNIPEDIYGDIPFYASASHTMDTGTEEWLPKTEKAAEDHSITAACAVAFLYDNYVEDLTQFPEHLLSRKDQCSEDPIVDYDPCHAYGTKDCRSYEYYHCEWKDESARSENAEESVERKGFFDRFFPWGKRPARPALDAKEGICKLSKEMYKMEQSFDEFMADFEKPRGEQRNKRSPFLTTLERIVLEAKPDDSVDYESSVQRVASEVSVFIEQLARLPHVTFGVDPSALNLEQNYFVADI